MLTFATAIVRAWTWLYTSGLDPDPRDDRRAQIESDLWDYKDDATEQGIRDAAMAAHVLARLLLGMPDDLLWRGEQLSVRAQVVPLMLGESRSHPVTFRRASGFGASATVHAVLVMLAVWLGPKVTTAALHGTSPAPSTTIIFIPPPDVVDPTGEKAASAADIIHEDNLGIAIADSDSTVTMPGFSFNFSKVVSRAGTLFPFVTGTAALDRIAGLSRLPQPTKGLINPFSRSPGRSSDLPPLQVGDAAVQALVDKAWARRDRWQAFSPLVPTVESHDPSAGELPALVRSYVEQNGLQPYVSDIHDSRLWTQLGVVADHADFIDFTSRYLARHASTRVGTELLFLLDTLVQGSYDTLTTLLDVIPEADLGWTRSSNRDAYDAIVTIQQHYRSELERHNLTTRTSLRLYFDEARLSILTNLIETTPNGYRASDARFLIGSIYWKQGRLTEAVSTWSQLRADASDRYASASADIRNALGALTARTMKDEDILRIGQILDAERGRWISFSHDRLKQFGYRFNVF